MEAKEPIQVASRSSLDDKLPLAEESSDDWIAPTTGISGVYASQPLGDKKALPLYLAFEKTKDDQLG